MPSADGPRRSLPGPRVTATICRNDPPVVAAPVISTGDVVVGESAGYAEFVVRLSAPSSNLVSVVYDTSDGTANHLAFDGIGNTMRQFAPGETLKTVRIAIVYDAAVEDVESSTSG